jgi:hypothetical protein
MSALQLRDDITHMLIDMSYEQLIKARAVVITAANKSDCCVVCTGWYESSVALIDIRLGELA